MLPYALTIFLSAFLLFQVQPIIGKMILPWFGGSAGVWATCLLFFQTALLLGYLYSHGLANRLRPRAQWVLHSTLLAVCLVTLPIIPNTRWKPLTPEAPALHILALLAVTIGLPYFLLSTTGPLIQAWFVQAHPGKIPYRLYALSNAGSMLALLTYPPLFEPSLTLHHQAMVWSAAFGVFTGLCIFTGWRSSSHAQMHVELGSAEDDPPPQPGPAEHLFWIALAVGPSMLLLALTTHMSMDVAPMPFLWVLPLAIYLLSFILCFDAPGWYKRNLFLALAAPALGGLLYLFRLSPSDRPNLRITIPLYGAAFFIACMICHGELARRKPHPRHLTSYFLMIAAGGALGGVLVALVAPAVFRAYHEFPSACIFIAVLALISVYLDRGSVFRRDWLGWPSILALSVVAGVAGYGGHVIRESEKGSLLVARNFYGELRVNQYNTPGDWDCYRSLVHGSINHGEQYMHPQRRHLAATYYCPDSGAGLYMQSRVVGTPQKVAVVGLGTGTLAAYAQVGDLYRFYEINPLVPQIARRQFYYLNESYGTVEVVMGDARLSMEREPAQDYDLIAVDAFSSDSIPVHLLTREALVLYFRELKPDGVLAMHVSNRYIDLVPVLERGATSLGKFGVVVDSDDSEDGSCYGTTWVLLANDPHRFDRQSFRGKVEKLQPAPWLRAWTDDYSNLYKVLK
jgi:SAM-dependent methyltransferase